MNKRLLSILMMLLALSLFAACGPARPVTGDDIDPAPAAPEQTPEETARQFLELMLDDDRELQLAILQNVTAVNAGMIDPSDEQREAMNETALRLDGLLRDKFAVLVSPDILDKRIKDGSLMQYERLLGGARAVAELSGCLFETKGDTVSYTAQVTCRVNGSQLGDSVPIKGEVEIGKDGLITGFTVDSTGDLSRLLAQEVK
ncbi:MAG: hypothetical protein IKD93_07530 [Firmicutes bacterium]|nr:hypothetical protein [Bacillota bacterium]